MEEAEKKGLNPDTIQRIRDALNPNSPENLEREKLKKDSKELIENFLRPYIDSLQLTCDQIIKERPKGCKKLFDLGERTLNPYSTSSYSLDNSLAIVASNSGDPYHPPKVIITIMLYPFLFNGEHQIKGYVDTLEGPAPEIICELSNGSPEEISAIIKNKVLDYIDSKLENVLTRKL